MYSRLPAAVFVITDGLTFINILLYMHVCTCTLKKDKKTYW